jgi:hypothetical protein
MDTTIASSPTFCQERMLIQANKEFRLDIVERVDYRYRYEHHEES